MNKQTESKIVTSPAGTEYQLFLAKLGGLACCICGAPITAKSYLTVCPDYGGLICEDCVMDGHFDGHQCDK